MTVNPKLHRVYELREPQPMRVEIHDLGCPCCTPPKNDALTFTDLGQLAWCGMLSGTAIAFVLDPAGTVHALAAFFGVAA